MKTLALAASLLAGAALGPAALAQAPAGKPGGASQEVRPSLGAGPHRDFREMEGGNGERLREGAPEPKLPEPASGPPAAAPGGSGGASAGNSSPEEAQRRKEQGAAEHEDERRATERKEKAKQRPGYREEAPSPRAAR